MGSRRLLSFFWRRHFSSREPPSPDRPASPTPPSPIRRPAEVIESTYSARRRLPLYNLPRTSVRPNGMIVVARQDYLGHHVYSLYIKAGTRYENYNERGVSHYIRRSLGLDTADYSAFMLNSLLNLDGANMTCEVTREHVVYIFACRKDKSDEYMTYMNSFVCKQVFKPWQIDEAKFKQGIEINLAEQDDCHVLLEALHKVAFRTGLGNDIIIPREMVDVLNTESISAYYKRTFSADRALFAVSGMDLEEAERLSDRFQFHPSSNLQDVPTKLGGGEVRIAKWKPYGLIAIGMAVLGKSDKKEHLAIMVLQYILGIPPMKNGRFRSVGKLHDAVKKLTPDPLGVSCFNYAYSDARLFGFALVGQPEQMSRLVNACVGEMAAVSASVTEQDVEIGKARAISAIFITTEKRHYFLDHVATSILLRGEMFDFFESEQTIKDLTPADIRNVAQKILGGRLVMSALGNLSDMPYLDKLRRYVMRGE